MTRRIKPPVALYSALADATRCRIIEILQSGPLPVHTLADAFAISRPAISRHLRVLKTAGLVAEVKKGRENLYALKPARLSGATRWIDAVFQRENEGGAVPERPAQVANTQRPDRSAAKPSQSTPTERSRPTRTVNLVAEAAEPPLFPAKTEKTPRETRQAPANQMGFDF